MTRFLIAGSSGMLGTALQTVLTARGVGFDAPSESVFDITDAEAVATQVRGFAASLEPGVRGVLVNAAAYTNVEQAEDHPDIAFSVNERGARLLAEAARDQGLGFVHVSTDFVFDGTKRGPYNESDEPAPLSIYGMSKLAGEHAVHAAYAFALIVRTAWVFGEGGANFPTKILDLAERMPVIKVVTDEIGSPTYTIDLAEGIIGLVQAQAHGLYHLAGAGSCSRFELAQAVLELAGSDATVEPVVAAEFPTRAARPANSVLDCAKAAALGVRMPPWRDALARFIAGRTGQAVS